MGVSFDVVVCYPAHTQFPGLSPVPFAQIVKVMSCSVSSGVLSLIQVSCIVTGAVMSGCGLREISIPCSGMSLVITTSLTVRALSYSI